MKSINKILTSKGKSISRDDNPDRDIEDKLMNIFGEATMEAVLERDGLEHVDNVAVTALKKERNRRCAVCCTFLCYLTAISLLILALIAALAVKDEISELDTLPKIEEYVKSLSNSSDFEDDTSPQSKALNWILEQHIEDQVKEAKVEAKDVETKVFIDDDLKEKPEILRQRYVMAVLYYTLNGDDWISRDRWLSYDTKNICEWYSTQDGNICDGDGLLQILRLNGNNLRGKLPAMELQHLSKQLTVLDITQNNISGTIPTELGSLTLLEKLSFSKNKLEGTVPTELQRLENLQLLRLDSNPKLKGIIANEICNLGIDDEIFITLDCTTKESADTPSDSKLSCDCPSCSCCTDQTSCNAFVSKRR